MQEKRKKSVPHSGLREALLATTLAPALPKLQEANATGISQNIKDAPPLEKQISAAMEPYKDPIIDPFEIPSDRNHPPRRLGGECGDLSADHSLFIRRSARRDGPCIGRAGQKCIPAMDGRFGKRSLVNFM